MIMDSIHCNLNVNFNEVAKLRMYMIPMKKNSGDKLTTQALKKYVSKLSGKSASYFNRWDMTQLLNELIKCIDSSAYREFYNDIFKLNLEENNVRIYSEDPVITEDGRAFIRIDINNELHHGNFSCGYLYYGVDEDYHIFIPVKGNKILYWNGRFSPVGLRNTPENHSPMYNAEEVYFTEMYPDDIYIQQNIKNNLANLLHLLCIYEPACLEEFHSIIKLN